MTSGSSGGMANLGNLSLRNRRGSSICGHVSGTVSDSLGPYLLVNETLFLAIIISAKLPPPDARNNSSAR